MDFAIAFKTPMAMQAPAWPLVHKAGVWLCLFAGG